MSKGNSPKHWTNIKIVVNGIEVSGAYSIDRTDWMTVRMDGGGSKDARGGPAAKNVAELILRELCLESSR